MVTSSSLVTCNMYHVWLLTSGNVSATDSMGVFEFILDLILQPGSSLTLIPAINVTVLLLLVLLACLLYYSSIAMVHILAMASLSLGLMLSVNWFVLPSHS